jgi:YfiH family protein
MIHRNRGDIHFLQFDNFNKCGLQHGFFMRHGGVSQKPWESLNLGGNSGDHRSNIIENRRRIFAALDRKVESLYDVWQVHSDEIVIVDAHRPLDVEPIQADALLTDKPSVTLFMRFADCVPIFLFDPSHHVIGMVHAGWMGTVKQIVLKTIMCMAETFASRAEDIIAGIGPSICVDHFQIKEDVIEQVRNSLTYGADQFLVEKNGNTFLNLQMANQAQLLQAGVNHIETSGICTACNVSDWFSHRGEHGSTGRFGALLTL